MNDLNQKLGIGPPKEKEKEPEPVSPVEAKPLEDARKGRAKGPQRRAPAKSPTAAAAAATPQPMSFSISRPQSLWHIDNDNGLLKVYSHEFAEASIETKTVEELGSTANDTLQPLVPPGISTDPARDPVDSSVVATQFRSSTAAEHTDGDLNILQKTTSGTISGHSLDQEEPNPNADAVPVSRQTTASDVTGSTLEPAETKAPDELSKVEESAT